MLWKAFVKDECILSSVISLTINQEIQTLWFDNWITFQSGFQRFQSGRYIKKTGTKAEIQIATFWKQLFLD